MTPSGKPHYDWTPERVARLTELVEAGHTSQEVADRLGGQISRNACIGKAARIGLAWRGPPGVNRRGRTLAEAQWLEDEPRLREMLAAGWTTRAIAAALGRSVGAIRHKTQRLDLDLSNRPDPVRLPRELPPPPPVEPSPLAYGPVPFLDRRAGMCAWPLWEPPARTGLCCGAETAKGEPYCAEHKAVAWIGTRYSRQRASVVTQGAIGEEWQ